MVSTNKLQWMIVLSLWFITLNASRTQTLTTLVDFDGSNGAAAPAMSLVQSVDGTLYGTTSGGNYDYGSVFKVTPSGELTILYSFCSQPDCVDGANPYGGVILATDGNFYGMTYNGGSNLYYGTVFKITPNGLLTTLHSFGTDGSNPTGGLVQGKDGNFYGQTNNGGLYNHGTFFKVTPSGGVTILYNFCAKSGCADGAYPVGTPVQTEDGSFYGTTNGGGTGYWYGTVFRITKSGALTTLHSFNFYDGQEPLTGLIEASDGRLYGTTAQGGTGCSNPGCGTVFRITKGGKLNTVHLFNNADGNFPSYALLSEGTDGNLYGATEYGGDYSAGTLFKIVPSGGLTTLYSFCSLQSCSAGYAPFGGLFQLTTGEFFGTTFVGGDYSKCFGSGCGTLFSLDMGLGPFVSFVRGYGKIGQSGGILGQGFTGTTSVTLNGVPASFTVKSDTYLVATIPPGATTGYVAVTTPTGTLTSNKKFVVLP